MQNNIQSLAEKLYDDKSVEFNIEYAMSVLKEYTKAYPDSPGYVYLEPIGEICKATIRHYACQLRKD